MIKNYMEYKIRVEIDLEFSTFFQNICKINDNTLLVKLYFSFVIIT